MSEFPYWENSSRTPGRPILGVAWDFLTPKAKGDCENTILKL